MTALEHTPLRPDWECRADGEAWPCELARKRLRDEYAEYPTVTALYLTSQQRDFLDDRETVDLDELYERFIGWVRENPKPDPGE